MGVSVTSPSGEGLTAPWVGTFTSPGVVSSLGVYPVGVVIVQSVSGVVVPWVGVVLHRWVVCVCPYAQRGRLWVERLPLGGGYG